MKYYIVLIILLFGFGFLTDINFVEPAKGKEIMLGRQNNMNSGDSGWIALNHVDQITEIIKESRNKPVLIYKHSTACGISHMTESRLKQDWDEIKDKVTLYYLDLLTYRTVSNEISRIFNVVHQSPQLILVVDGKAVSSWSHYEVSVKPVLKEL
ncbi:bacillithiol system redox-active protein YtxJ [Bacteroidota bacterium]